MRLRIQLVCCAALAVVAMPSAVRAQGTTAPASGSQDPQAAAPAQSASSSLEGAPSLFQPTWRQVTFGGRSTSIDGDPARFQRYQDIRDGVLLTGTRYAFENPEGLWLFQGAADNVGWRDQRYFGNYERIGQMALQQIRPDLAKMGLDLTAFYIENISLPAEVEKALDKRTQMGVLGDLQRYTQFQTAEAIPEAARNPGGIAGVGAGLAAGVAMGNQMSGALQQAQQPLG